jgi:hypothetical protein
VLEDARVGRPVAGLWFMAQDGAAALLHGLAVPVADPELGDVAEPLRQHLLVGRLPAAPDELLGLALGLGAVGALLAAGLGRGDCYLRWASASRIGLATIIAYVAVASAAILSVGRYTGLTAMPSG